MQSGLKLLRYCVLTWLSQLLELFNITCFCAICSFSKTVLLIKSKMGSSVKK